MNESYLMALGAVLSYFDLKNRIIEAEDEESLLMMNLQNQGLLYRRFAADEKWYQKVFCPLIVKDKTGEVLALLPGDDGLYHVQAKKPYKISRNNAAAFGKEMIMVYRPLPAKKMNFWDLLLFVRNTESKKDHYSYTVCALLSTILMTALPSFTNSVLSSIAEDVRPDPFFVSGFFLLLLSFFSVLFTIGKDLIFSSINVRAQFQLEAAVIMRLINMPSSFYRQHSPSKLTNQVYNIRLFAEYLENLKYTIIMTPLTALVYLAQIFVIDRLLFGSAVLIIVLIIMLQIIVGISRTRYVSRWQRAGVYERSIAYAYIRGMQKIRLAGAEERAYRHWEERYDDFYKVKYKPPLFTLIGPILISAVALLGEVAIYIIAITNHIPLATFYSFSTAYVLAMANLLVISQASDSISQIIPLYELARPILENLPETNEAKPSFGPLKGAIEFRNVTFAYNEDEDPVIKDLSLKIDPGEYLAIVGKTGCGKSTLIRLLLGFEKPQQGQVLIDGKDLNDYDLRSLRRQIGTVLQDGKLFQGDIYFNIVIAAPWIDEEKAMQAAETAGLKEDLEKMPMGIHTMINGNSNGVSGGQKQRIMIARAIVNDPKIIIFDEATSALDNSTQKMVSANLDQMDCSRIVVAHRLSTIRNCDRIIMLEDGKIVEDGTYEQLISNKAQFAEMVSRQQIETEGENDG